jgi:hypothetical protein
LLTAFPEKNSQFYKAFQCTQAFFITDRATLPVKPEFTSFKRQRFHYSHKFKSFFFYVFFQDLSVYFSYTLFKSTSEQNVFRKNVFQNYRMGIITQLYDFCVSWRYEFLVRDGPLPLSAALLELSEFELHLTLKKNVIVGRKDSRLR